MPAPGYAPLANYAGFWIRVVAYIIDAIILSVIGGIINAIFQVNFQNPTSGNYTAANGLSVLISIAYFAGLWTYMGATLGQRIFGIRVVDANTGQRLTIGKALVRWVGLFIAFIVCFVGVIWVAFDPRKQGWADKIAGTLVMRG